MSKARIVAAAAAAVMSVATVGVLASPAAAATSGGPVVLDGMDPLCHSASGSPTGAYVTAVLSGLRAKVSRANNGSIAVLGSAATETNPCGSVTYGTQLTTLTSTLSPVPALAFSQTPTEIDTFFSALATHSVDPAVIYVPDDWGRAGAVDTALTAHASDLADFVNSGGGLFTDKNGYGWLTALLPQAVYADAGCTGGPSVTVAGKAAFPSLTDLLVASCWHGHFTGSTGSLVPLIDWNGATLSDPRLNIAIGGGSVTLPSDFSITGPAGAHPAGTPVTVTATVQDHLGAAIAGLPVTFTVTGPDHAVTRTASTDSGGQVTLTLPGAGAGTDTVTATATINSAVKTTSYDVVFAPSPDPIAAKYAALGGTHSLLGGPTGPEFVLQGGRGQHFERGSIYYSAVTGAHEVNGAIAFHYASLAGPAGILGYPTSDELQTADHIGRVQTFAGSDRAAIYWSPRTGANSVHGWILAHYLTMGGPQSLLGYPTSDERETLDGGGRFNFFSGGLLMWSNATGAHAVHGVILNLYARLLFGFSRLGYPTSDEYAVSGGRRSDFAGGHITYSYLTHVATAHYGT